MTTQYEIVLLRHGQSEGNAQKIYQGQADFPLTPKGREQAQVLADYWLREKRTFLKIITSPLSRARETAAIIAQTLQVPLEENPLWLERDIGSLAGRKSFPKHTARAFYNPYYGESDHAESDWDLFLRAGRALRALLDLTPGAYLVVSHGGMLNQTVRAILGIAPYGQSCPRFRFTNTGFAVFTYRPDMHLWYMHKLNNVPHLKN